MARPYSSMFLMMAGLAVFSAHAAETPSDPACSIDGVAIGNDIDFNERFKRIAPLAGSARVTCNTVWHADTTVDEMRLRISLATLAHDNGDHTPIPASLVRIEKLIGDKPSLLGWGVLPDHEQEDPEKLMPQFVKKSGALLIRIGPRHRHLYSLVGSKFERVPAFEWRSALNVDPALTKGGQPLGIDLERMEGRIALVCESGNPPVGQSAYNNPKIAVAQLDFVDGKLVQGGEPRDQVPTRQAAGLLGLWAGDRGFPILSRDSRPLET